MQPPKLNYMSTEKRVEELLKTIEEFPIDKEYVPVEGLFIPLNDWVLILPVEQEAYKKRIILPNVARNFGIVYGIGSLSRLPIKVGMRVIFEPNVKDPITITGIDGRDYFLMMSHLVYAIVTPGNYVHGNASAIKTKLEIRNDERREGIQKAEANDLKKVEEGNAKSEHKKKTISIPKI